MIFALVWVAIAAVGIGVQIATVLSSRGDLRFLRAMGWEDPGVRMLAEIHLRSGLARLIVVTLNLLVGVAALLPLSPDAQRAFGAAIACVLIINEGMLVGSSILERRTRRRLVVMGSGSSAAPSVEH